MKTLKERIEIETDYDNGKNLDFRILSAKIEAWYELPENEDDIVFQWDMNDYRVKSELITRYVVIFSDGKNSGRTYKSKEQALNDWGETAVFEKVVKLVEVIE